MRVIVVLEGDQTGQELLDEALRVLAPDVTGIDLEFPRFDLSLENRRATKNGVVYEAATALREAGLGLKAATITPEGANDVGPVLKEPGVERTHGLTRSAFGSNDGDCRLARDRARGRMKPEHPCGYDIAAGAKIVDDVAAETVRLRIGNDASVLADADLGRGKRLAAGAVGDGARDVAGPASGRAECRARVRGNGDRDERQRADDITR